MPMGNGIIKNYMKNVLLSLLSIVVGFLLAEVLLWFVGISYPSFYTWDAYLGPVLKPGATGWWKKEGLAYVTINEEGLRDNSHTLKKPENTVRIAVLGDSYAEAFQVSLEKTFWKVMERDLNTNKTFYPKQVEIINFGVSGYGTAQELMTLRTRVWEYEPDIILLAFLTGNDIRNNSKQLNGIDSIPYFTVHDKDLRLDTGYQNSHKYKFHQRKVTKFLEYLINYSRVLQVLNEALNSIKAHRVVRSNVAGAEVGLDEAIYKVPLDEHWENAWETTEAILTQMNEEIKEKTVQFFVVTLTNGIQVNPDKTVRQEVLDTLGVKNFYYPETRIKELGEKEGFEVINLVYPMLEYAEKTSAYLHGFKDADGGSGHWNERGHAVAGEILSREIALRIEHKN